MITIIVIILPTNLLIINFVTFNSGELKGSYVKTDNTQNIPKILWNQTFGGIGDE